VVASACWSLWMRQGQEFSLPGLAVALAAIPIMYILKSDEFSLPFLRSWPCAGGRQPSAR
jgi:hypothetical protein